VTPAAEGKQTARIIATKQISVIPAWRAGIQVCTDASGDIPVGADPAVYAGNDTTAKLQIEQFMRADT